MKFSVIVPVYNRPQELRELLESLSVQRNPPEFEVIVIEDGSAQKSDKVLDDFPMLDIKYHFKPNSGPGDSRNKGMAMCSGDYFLIFDSDCILPVDYLRIVADYLTQQRVDFFGGPDAALDTFSSIQKAINFAMTSFLTTGGIRGGSEKLDTFQPRSFNMGISRIAFERSGGFGDIHPGEDPDLAIRLWKMGFTSQLFPKAYVYHKRRIDWQKFSLQVKKFGKARPILDLWHPGYKKYTYLFPTLFIVGFVTAAVFALFGFYWPVCAFVIYFAAIFLVSSAQSKSLKIGALSIIAVWKQFYGYGTGYLESWIRVGVFKQDPRLAFPELFFAKNKMES